MTASPHRQSQATGVALLALAVLLFALMDTTTKYLSVAYAVPMVVAVRYIGNLVLVSALAGPRQGRALLAARRWQLVVARGFCLVVTSLFFSLALSRMPVGEATGIMFLAPMIVMLLARPILGETIGLAGWMAALIGFGGVLLIVRPGSGLDPLGIAFALASVGATVAYHLLSRLLAATESPTTMLFYTVLCGALCFGAYLPWSWGGPAPGLQAVLLFLSLGVYGAAGHFLFTLAYRHAPASLLAPVNNLQLVWAVLLGWLVFGHVPDGPTIAGMAVVAASGAMIAVRSRRG